MNAVKNVLKKRRERDRERRKEGKGQFRTAALPPPTYDVSYGRMHAFPTGLSGIDIRKSKKISI